MLEFIALAYQCSPNVAHETLAAIVKIESSYNPYAIGVVGGQLARQPKTRDEAIATANMLYQYGYNFSMGLAQVNLKNLPRYNATIETIFDPCVNLKTGGLILEECYLRAASNSDEQMAIRQALSCYYSGNFIRGFKPDSPNMPSYVEQVVSVALSNKPNVPKILHYNLADHQRKAKDVTAIQLKNPRIKAASPQVVTQSKSVKPLPHAVAPTQKDSGQSQNVMIQTVTPDRKVVF